MDNRTLTIHFKRVLALIADTHVGSKYAVFPDGFYDAQGGNISAYRNNGQLQILEHYNNFLKICDQYGVDTVILDGDLTAGKNAKEYGTQSTTVDLDEQQRAATQLLKPLCKNRIVHVFSGSKYHESSEARIHWNIADSLQSVAKKSMFHGALANIELKSQEGYEDTVSKSNPPEKGYGRILNISHGVSQAIIYRTLVMDREGLFEAAAYGLGELEFLPDIIVRAHYHFFAHLHFKKQHLIQIPGWCAFTPWKGALSNYGKMQPDIGGLILFVDSNDILTLHHYLMSHNPHISDFLRTG